MSQIKDRQLDIPQPTTSRVWYVSQDGNDTTGTGTENNPFLTIQTALVAAIASPGTATIMIGPGAFTGSFDIPRGYVFRGTQGTVLSGGTLSLDFSSAASWLAVSGSSSFIDIEMQSYVNASFGGGVTGATDFLTFESCYFNVSSLVPIANVFGTQNSLANLSGAGGANPHFMFKGCSFAAGTLMILDLSGTLIAPLFRDGYGDVSMGLATSSIGTYIEVVGGFDNYRGVQFYGSGAGTVELHGFVCTGQVALDAASTTIVATSDLLAGRSTWAGNPPVFSGGATSAQINIVTPSASGIATAATLSALTLLDDTTLLDGAIAAVTSNRSEWVLDKTSTLPTGFHVQTGFTADVTVRLTLSGTGRWLRKFVGHERYIQQTTWYLDHAGGSDELDGLTSITPLKTFKELKYRLGPRFKLIADVTVNVNGPYDYTDPFDIDIDTINTTDGGNPIHLLNIVGTLTASVSNINLTNVTAQNPATATALQLVPNIAYSSLVRVVSSGTGSHVGATSYVMFSSGGVPYMTPFTAFGAGPITPSIGDHVTTYLSNTSVWTNALRCEGLVFKDLTLGAGSRVKNAVLYGCFVSGRIELDNCTMTACAVGAGQIVGGFGDYDIQPNGNTTPPTTTMTACWIFGDPVVSRGAHLTIAGHSVLTNTLYVNRGGHVVINNMQMRGFTAPNGILVDVGGTVDILDGDGSRQIWGGNNSIGVATINFQYARSGGCYETGVTSLASVVGGGGGTDVQIVGANVAWASLPSFNTAQQAGFIAK